MAPYGSFLELPDLKLNLKQDEFIFAEEQFVCIKGTWGCGKSLAGLLAADRECMEHPGNLYLVLRKEWVDLRDSTMKDWASEIGKPITDGDVRYGNGSILMFRHGNDLNSLKNTNLGGALMIQAEEEAEETLWFLKGRLRRKQGTRQLRLECNYHGRNWIYNLFNERKLGRLITTNTFDNEVNLPADYIPGLKMLPEKLQRIHLYGSDEESEGLVFDEFKRGEHTIDPFDVPQGWERIVALDHGFTNPTAVLWGAVDHDGKIYIYDEHYEKETLVSGHAQAIKLRDNSKVGDWLIDPSCAAKTIQKNGGIFSIVDEYRDMGLHFRLADNNVLAGINRVNESLKAGKLQIFKNCVNLIREIEGYRWQSLRPGLDKNNPEAPIKKNDHAVDALRYMIFSRPSPTKIEEPKNKPFSVNDMERMERQQHQLEEVL